MNGIQEVCKRDLNMDGQLPHHILMALGQLLREVFTMVNSHIIMAGIRNIMLGNGDIVMDTPGAVGNYYLWITDGQPDGWGQAWGPVKAGPFNTSNYQPVVSGTINNVSSSNVANGYLSGGPTISLSFEKRS